MTDAAAETPAVNEEDVLRQLEFYFCDVAYPFDEFLQSKATRPAPSRPTSSRARRA